jgi:hypothetical protein
MGLGEGLGWGELLKIGLMRLKILVRRDGNCFFGVAAANVPLNLAVCLCGGRFW